MVVLLYNFVIIDTSKCQAGFSVGNYVIFNDGIMICDHNHVTKAMGKPKS